jgi:glutamate synthase (NADPH/NADH) large chain
LRSSKPCNRGLYRPDHEHDACGFGLIANLDDQPSHWLVRTAMSALVRLTHRGAVAADGKTGDGCGLLLKSPTRFLQAVAGETGIKLARNFAVGCVFLDPHAPVAARARSCHLPTPSAQPWREVDRVK